MITVEKQGVSRHHYITSKMPPGSGGILRRYIMNDMAIQGYHQKQKWKNVTLDGVRPSGVHCSTIIVINKKINENKITYKKVLKRGE